MLNKIFSPHQENLHTERKENVRHRRIRVQKICVATENILSQTVFLRLFDE